MPAGRPLRRGTRWTSRFAPLLLLAAAIFATYAVIPRLCVGYLLQSQGQTAAAAVLIALYLVLLFLAALCFLRAMLSARYEPGLVPLPDSVSASQNAASYPSSTRDLHSDSARSPDPYPALGSGPDSDPEPDLDSPGLEKFYSRDFFVCESDGRPRWCSECRNWKPDRAHHSRELGRCVFKMDHFCPWIGGMVSETSFNFFAQFTAYGTLYNAICFITSVYCLALQLQPNGPSPDIIGIVTIALSGLFGLFSLGMLGSCLRYILTNRTNIDMMRFRHTYFLAVALPRDCVSPAGLFSTVTYHLPPLPAPPQSLNGEPAAQLDDTALRRQQKVNPRDLPATRTFAILRTLPDENPWDLGWRANWRSVMGNNLLEYLLPLRHSPCTRRDDLRSMYPTGPLIPVLRSRYGIDRMEASSRP